MSERQGLGGATEIIPSQDWFTWWVANADEEGNIDGFYRNGAYPVGWGGTVTDTSLQGQAGGWSKAFEQTIGCNSGPNRNLKLAAVEDPVKFVIVSDTGVKPEPGTWGNMVFPDTCNAECCCNECYPEFNDCFEDCDVDDAFIIKTQELARKFWSDGDMRRSYARHLGEVNFGFLDGHAAWWQCDAVYSNTDGGQNHIQDTTGDLEGMWCFCRHNLDWEGD